MSGTRWTADDLTALAKKRLEKPPVATCQPYTLVYMNPTKHPKRIRQNAEGLNKTEQAFLDYLRTELPQAGHLVQAITLRLANGVRYTPDFFSYFTEDFNKVTVVAYEVKGYMRDDASVKIKVAASLYPWITFKLVTKHGKEWQIDSVLS